MDVANNDKMIYDVTNQGIPLLMSAKKVAKLEICARRAALAKERLV